MYRDTLSRIVYLGSTFFFCVANFIGSYLLKYCCSCVKCESRPPSRPSLRRRQNSAPSNVEPCTLWPQHLRQPFVLRGARGGTALLDLQLDGGASPPGHARLLLGV